MVEVVPVPHHHNAVHQVAVEGLVARQLHAALRLRRRAWLQAVDQGRLAPRRWLRPHHLPRGGDCLGDCLGGRVPRRARGLAARVDEGRLEPILELGDLVSSRHLVLVKTQLGTVYTHQEFKTRSLTSIPDLLQLPLIH